MGKVVLDYPDKIFCLAGKKKAMEKKKGNYTNPNPELR